MNSPSAPPGAINRRFVAQTDRAHLKSVDRPDALRAVEEEILHLGSGSDREEAQDTLLRSQDALRMPLPGVRPRFTWIGCVRLTLDRRDQESEGLAAEANLLSPQEAFDLWRTLDESVQQMRTEAPTGPLLDRRPDAPTWPGVILHAAVRCDAVTRLWIGFYAFANLDRDEMAKFSVEGSAGRRSLFVAMAVADDTMSIERLQDPNTAIPQDGTAATYLWRLKAGLVRFEQSHPSLVVGLDDRWLRLSEVVRQGEVDGAIGALEGMGAPFGQNKDQAYAWLRERCPSGVDVVAGSLRTGDPLPGQAAMLCLCDRHSAIPERFVLASLLAGTPLELVARACTAELQKHGIDAKPICLEPRPPVKQAHAGSFLFPCPDGKYRDKQTAFFGRSAWHFKRLDWYGGWAFDGPAFDSDEAVRRLGGLPHPVAIELAGLDQALRSHYEDPMLLELREQMAIPGRSVAVAAGQIRLKHPELFDLQNDQEERGYQFEDGWFVQDDSLQPPDGVYAAAHWKAAGGVLMVAKRSLIARLDSTSIESGFPLRYVQLPFRDIFVHFEEPLVHEGQGGRRFFITGFYANEEPAAEFMKDDSIERLVVVTYTYHYTGEVLRLGGLSVPLLIGKEDERDLTDVVAEHGKLIEEHHSASADERGELKFTTDMLLVAAKVVLYTTMKNARLVERRDRQLLLDQLRGLKGSKREKLQARLKKTFDCIVVGPEEVDEDAVLRSLEAKHIKPHWRRGVLRNQRYGEGLSLTRKVWIAPVLVNGHLVDGQPPPRKDYLLD